MPDMERVLDDLSINLAKSPEKKQYALGVVAGKKKARIEVLVVVAVLYFGVALIGKFSG